MSMWVTWGIDDNVDKGGGGVGPLMATWCGGVVVIVMYGIIDVDRVTWPIDDNMGIVIANVVDVGGMGIVVIDDLGDMPHQSG